MEPADRVRKLRALADRTTFPHEAEACRDKAAALMAKHGLTEAQVAPIQQQPRVPFQQPQHGWGTILLNGVPINMPMPVGFPQPTAMHFGTGNGTSAQQGFVRFTVRYG